MRRSVAALALGGAVLGVAGCAVSPPGSSPARVTSTRVTSARALVVQANRAHEYPAPAPRQAVVGGWRNAAQAVSVFAVTYINWTAATVSARLQALAEVSLGQAHSVMLLAASETARDYELRRSSVANHGTLEAVAPLPSAPHQYVVVTREETTSAIGTQESGLAPAWHVTLAAVTRVAGGLWVLSRWQPES